MKSNRPPYSLLVPILALIVSSAIILYPALSLYDRLRTAHVFNGDFYFGNGTLQVIVPRSHLFSWAFQITTIAPWPNIMAANLPGYILAAPLNLLSGGFLTWTKRLVSAPLFCIPAWWFLGYGIDGLVGTRTLRWRSMLAGTLLFAAFLTMALGFIFGMSSQERAEMTVSLWGFFFWAAAFVVPCVAWLRQRFLRSTNST